MQINFEDDHLVIIENKGTVRFFAQVNPRKVTGKSTKTAKLFYLENFPIYSMYMLIYQKKNLQSSMYIAVQFTKPGQLARLTIKIMVVKMPSEL